MDEGEDEEAHAVHKPERMYLPKIYNFYGKVFFTLGFYTQD